MKLPINFREVSFVGLRNSKLPESSKFYQLTFGKLVLLDYEIPTSRKF